MVPHSKNPARGRFFPSVYVMLLPNLILFLAISVYPVVWALKYMLYDFDGVNAARFIGAGNFERLFFRDPNFWRTVVNTLIYAVGKIILILPPAFFAALALNKRRRGGTALQAVLFSPTIMSSAVMSLVFFLLFNAYNGDINVRLMSLHLISEPLNWLGKDMAMFTVILVAVWGGLGNYMVYFLAGLQRIPEELYESAALDGVNWGQRLVHVTLPLLGPVLKIILMLSILAAFQDIQSIMVLTGGGPFERTDVMFLYIYQLYFPISADASGGGSQFGYGAAASCVAAAIVGLVTLAYLRISRKLDEIY
jgi:raffinose/stachyose/melibiose transport system permease protein